MNSSPQYMGPVTKTSTDFTNQRPRIRNSFTQTYPQPGGPLSTALSTGDFIHVGTTRGLRPGHSPKGCGIISDRLYAGGPNIALSSLPFASKTAELQPFTAVRTL